MSESIESRLKRAEGQVILPGGRCPDCPPLRLVTYRQDGPDSEPIPEAGEEPPGHCPRCGRECDVTRIVEVIVNTREEAERFGKQEGP